VISVFAGNGAKRQLLLIATWMSLWA